MLGTGMTYRFPSGGQLWRNQHSGGQQHCLRSFRRTGAGEVVTAVGEFVKLDVLGQQLPVPVAYAEPWRSSVVGGNHDSYRRGQPFRRRIVQDVGEIVVRRDVVVAVRGTDMLGAFR